MGGVHGAIPLAHVVETMRPLPVNPLSGAHPPVLGVAIIRGGPVPVLDAARLVSGHAGNSATRFVCVRVRRDKGEEHVAALAVDEVLGVVDLSGAELAPLPPLLSSVSSELVTWLGRHEQGLLLVLDAALLVPEAAWRTLSARAEAER